MVDCAPISGKKERGFKNLCSLGKEENTMMFIIVFSFLCRHHKLLLDTFVEIVVLNLLTSTEINKTTIIRIIICSIINFIYKM